MPLIANKNLPSFARLYEEGSIIHQPQRMPKEDIPELHIGLLNMMPDNVLQATEQQFFRLVGASNLTAHLYIHPFSLPELAREADMQAYIAEYYEDFENIRDNGLDALIVTGAYVNDSCLEDLPLWLPLQKILDWACNNVTSTICSCLAVQAYLQSKHNTIRKPLSKKLSGIYKNRVIDRLHPLVRNMNTVFDVPHSRLYGISEKQFLHAGMNIVLRGEESGVSIATSADGFRVICIQGHPEYDTKSLMKEFVRDLKLFYSGALQAPPAYPEYYFGDTIRGILSQDPTPDQIESLIGHYLNNTWRDSAKSIFTNWIRHIYQLTYIENKKQVYGCV